MVPEIEECVRSVISGVSSRTRRCWLTADVPSPIPRRVDTPIPRRVDTGHTPSVVVYRVVSRTVSSVLVSTPDFIQGRTDIVTSEAVKANCIFELCPPIQSTRESCNISNVMNLRTDWTAGRESLFAPSVPLYCRYLLGFYKLPPSVRAGEGLYN